jgi:hypothetical protein
MRFFVTKEVIAHQVQLWLPHAQQEHINRNMAYIQSQIALLAPLVHTAVAAKGIPIIVPTANMVFALVDNPRHVVNLAMLGGCVRVQG